MTASTNSKREGRVGVPSGLHWKSRFFAATSRFWRALGNLESRVVADETKAIEIDAPIYVTSLARSGTTVVTEMLAEHKAVTSHRYSDFPAVWTPYWRNWLESRTHNPPATPVERAHGDRIQITNDSPEAVEELIWSSFFPHLHDQDTNNVLGTDQRSPAFDRYYTEHIRKLLAVRGATRYLAKGNYNLSRLTYLHSLFPDARFLIPVRHPVNHIASLAKQHKLFSEAHALDQRVGHQLELAGHWEFGPFRRFVNLGDQQVARAINSAWSAGREVLGWAHYWNSSYKFIRNIYNNIDGMNKVIYMFKYEDLCTQSGTIIDRMLGHTSLDAGTFAATRADYESRLSLPDYYQPDFSAQEMETIRAVCGKTATDLGYTL
jgi:hypothetical protein